MKVIFRPVLGPDRPLDEDGIVAVFLSEEPGCFLSPIDGHLVSYQGLTAHEAHHLAMLPSEAGFVPN